MIEWLLATSGTAALGSVFPVVNIELYLLATVSQVDGVAWWALGLAATVGQLCGKALFYFAGKGSLTLGKRLGKLAEAKKGSRWAKWMETIQRRSQQRPWWGLAVLFSGAVTGIPPFTFMCFVSGAAGIPLIGWLAVSLAGRALHFLLVAGAPDLAQSLPVFGST